MHALAAELQVSQRIAWRILTLLRRMLSRSPLLRKLRGAVAVDDTCLGGRHKGKRGRGAAHKTISPGLKVRNGRVRSLVLHSVATRDIHAIFKTHVTKGARLYTDKLQSYRRVRRLGFRHRRVKYSGRFTRGQSHARGMEGHWGRLKPARALTH